MSKVRAAIILAGVAVTAAGCSLLADLGQFDGVVVVDASDGPPSTTHGGLHPDASMPAHGGHGDASAEAEAGPYMRAVRYDFENGNEGWIRNPYNQTQNWGIVDVAQVVDPTQVDGGTDGQAPNHCLAITYDSSLKPEAGASNNLEVVAAPFFPTNLGTTPGLTLSVDLYVPPDADIGSPTEFGVQDTTNADCFFVHYDTSDAGHGVWMTLSSNQTGMCGTDAGPTTPRQLAFQFFPHGAGTICIDNITW